MYFWMLFINSFIDKSLSLVFVNILSTIYHSISVKLYIKKNIRIIKGWIWFMYALNEEVKIYN